MTNDNLGIACCFIAGYSTVTRFDDVTFEEIEFREPIIHVEWALGIKAKKGSQIPLYKIRRFIVSDLKKNKVPIKLVTADGFEAADMKQLISKAGITTGYLSTDRTINPFSSLRSGVHEGRICLPKHEFLKKELKELEIHTKNKKAKIDHPDDGSKDIADAVAGCIYSSLENKIESKDMVMELAKTIVGKSRANVYERVKKGIF